jgi:hypothetical protein
VAAEGAPNESLADQIYVVALAAAGVTGPVSTSPPVQPCVCADDSAARPECRYRHIIGPRIGTQDRPVVALPARHVERPHAVGAHVAEGHWVAGWGSRRLGGRSGAASLTAKLVPGRHTEHLRHAHCSPAGEPKAAGLSTHRDRAPKRMLTGLQRGAGQPASPCSGSIRRDLGNGAAMTAFGESCRDSGHGFSSLFDHSGLAARKDNAAQLSKRC